MMTTLRNILLSLLLATFLSGVVAQETITIDECQRLAVAQSSANVQKELNEQLPRCC